MSTTRDIGALAKVSIGGTDVSPQLVVGLVVEESFHLPASCIITLADQDLKGVELVPGLSIGADVEVKVVSEGMLPAALFKGYLATYEVGVDDRHKVLRLVAYDALGKLHVGKTSASYTNENDGSVINTIAQSYGLLFTPDPALSTPMFDVIHRINLTDFEFIKGRAQERGMVVRVVTANGPVFTPAALKVAKPEDLGGATLKANRGSGPVVLTDFHARVSGISGVSKVRVWAWDAKNQKRIEGQAKGPTGKGTGDDMPASKSAKGISKAISGMQRDQQELTLVSHVVDSPAHADKVAESFLELLGASGTEADGVCVGNAEVHPGVTLDVEGAGSANGKWLVSNVRHVIDDEGYTTSFTVGGRNERSLLGLVRGDTSGPTHAGGKPIYGVVIGIVNDVKDPLNVGRVKIMLPWLDPDFITDWARVASAVAGDQRGLFAPLSVGDEVLVAFEQGDTRRPYVIGALWNPKQKVPQYKGGDDYQDNGKAQTWMVKSISGNFLAFRDSSSDNLVTVDVKDGKFTFTLDGQNQKIVMKSDGTIEIESKQDITIKSSMGAITLDAKKDISLKAGMGVSVEASTKMDLTANGMVNVKGATVNLG